MTATTLDTDYLVIGCGAVSMAFVDTMLDQSDASFVIVDRHHRPGGHWNDAYPFVRLHQPSAFYGVASTELGDHRIDKTGSNAGYYELASGTEVSAYFERVMDERFLPSGRVRYYPMSEVVAEGQFRSLLSDSRYDIRIRNKTVDGTFFNTTVPATHIPKFQVADSVRCVAPNALPRVAPEYRRFTILGGGKTAMDAAVWLLDAGANPDSIRWFIPRDSWLINRATTQPGITFAKQRIGGFIAQLEAAAAASSADDLFERMEKAGVMLRIDPATKPTMFHYATISEGEIDQLRRITQVERGGRVAQIEPRLVTLENSTTLEADADTLYVDCTATAVQFSNEKTVPVFTDDRITLQALTAPLVATSAAITAFVEANVATATEKNQLCTPVPLADTPQEWMVSFLGNAMNQNAWSQDPQLQAWLSQCRLDPNRRMPDEPDPTTGSSQDIGQLIRPALANLQRLCAA